MDDETMRALVDRALELSEDADITFAFQGGEPTCAGLGYFERFVTYVEERGQRQTVHFALQTNGYVIDDAWAEFFARHGFLVGVSLDGYRELHDWLRPDARGEGTYRRVMGAIEALRDHGVEFNILTVLTAQLAKHPLKLYKFYQREQLDYAQLIPCLPGLDDTEDEFSLTPELFSSFYKSFFRLWADEFQHGTYRSVTLFDNLIPMFAGVRPQQCGMLGSCSPQFVVESTGDVYPCDFYVLDQYLLGNVKTDSLADLAAAPALQTFLAEPRRPCSACADCPFEGICHKNCKRLNIAYYREDWCGYRDFLEDAAPAMQRIARALARRP